MAAANRGLVRYAKAGRIDLLAEWSASAGDSVNADSLWQGVLDAGWELVGRSLSDYDVRTWEHRGFPPRMRELFFVGGPEFIKDDDTPKSAQVATHLTVRNAGNLTGRDLDHSLVLCSGAVRLEGSAAW